MGPMSAPARSAASPAGAAGSLPMSSAARTVLDVIGFARRALAFFEGQGIVRSGC
jgi:hypothetical protein